jgi:hypothetical protein
MPMRMWRHTCDITLAIAQTLPLLVRRRWPATCLAVIGAGFIAYQLLRYPIAFVSLGLIIALYSIGAHQTRRRIAAAATATAVYVAFAFALHAAGSPETFVEYVTFSSGALHGYGDIEKQAGTLPDLVARSRAAGQPVELVEHGEPRPMAGPAEVAAYRVVHEALTNALKHAAGMRTVVEFHHGDQWLELAATTAGTTRSGLGRGSGRGLVGMRERVSVVGGDLGACASPDNGFRVHARIPLGVT